MATGAGRGTHTCSPCGGHRDPHGDITTPTGTPALPRRHWHPQVDKGARRPYRRQRDHRGTSARSRGHGGTVPHSGTGTRASPQGAARVPRPPPQVRSSPFSTSSRAQSSAELLGGGCRGGGRQVRVHERDGQRDRALGARGGAGSGLRARSCRGGKRWRSRHCARQTVLTPKGF